MGQWGESVDRSEALPSSLFANVAGRRSKACRRSVSGAEAVVIRTWVGFHGCLGGSCTKRAELGPMHSTRIRRSRSGRSTTTTEALWDTLKW